jgi:hypothetical protein
MNKYLVIIALAFTAACQANITPVAPTAQAGTADAPTPHLLSYCEFSVGAEPPSTMHPTATRHVPTEGDERVFYDYAGCDGRVPLAVELSGSVVSSIRVSGRGNCFQNLACVGDTYEQAVERFPNARRFLSKVEGATFSLLIRDGVTLVFDPETLRERCFDHPEECDAAIRQSQVTSIYLYRNP